MFMLHLIEIGHLGMVMKMWNVNDRRPQSMHCILKSFVFSQRMQFYLIICCSTYHSKILHLVTDVTNSRSTKMLKPAWRLQPVGHRSSEGSLSHWRLPWVRTFVSQVITRKTRDFSLPFPNIEKQNRASWMQSEPLHHLATTTGF